LAIGLITGAPGFNKVCDEIEEVQPVVPSVNVTLYVPAIKPVMLYGKVTPGADPDAGPDQLTVPVPVPETVIIPSFELHPERGVWLVEILGAGFTVTTTDA
jgi:hypothetical protein